VRELTRTPNLELACNRARVTMCLQISEVEIESVGHQKPKVFVRVVSGSCIIKSTRAYSDRQNLKTTR